MAKHSLVIRTSKIFASQEAFCQQQKWRYQSTLGIHSLTILETWFSSQIKILWLSPDMLESRATKSKLLAILATDSYVFATRRWLEISSLCTNSQLICSYCSWGEIPSRKILQGSQWITCGCWFRLTVRRARCHQLWQASWMLRKTGLLSLSPQKVVAFACFSNQESKTWSSKMWPFWSWLMTSG